ncbi:MAG: phenylpyruvate tautomerase MIF-related protein [Oscillospiraceae bacterium]|nr:phenylpyruvate tautomerase MIF-related protein [Oscillospiraceae bacterium]
MPYVNITTAKKLDEGTKELLYSKIGGLMPTLPGKNLDNTLVCINSGADMFMRGKPNGGAFVSVQCYKESPAESKKDFSAKIYETLKEVLGLGPDDCVYMNFTEFETWAANGKYF